MEVKVKSPPAQAMAFYHQDGLPSAWMYAMKFAGKNGRLATMPDIVEDRLNSCPGKWPWETYFTTTTAEYCGIGKNGKQILIVAHGIGPMSTLEGVQKAYSWQYQDKDRNRRGGRITQQEFSDLEDGKFGDVSIIDLDSYCKRYQYPFLQVLRSNEAETDPVLLARLGPYAKEYVEVHTFASRRWHNEQARIKPENKYHLPNQKQFLRHRRIQHLYDGDAYSNPYIIKLEDAANCCYTFGPQHGHRPIENGYAIAHLVSTGGLCHLHHEGNESLVFDVGLHEWWDGVRFVGIQAGYDVLTGFRNCPGASDLVHRYWRDLLIAHKEPLEFCFGGLVRINHQWFTQYPKPGESMDTYEPEFVVTSMKKIGGLVIFRTTVGGYHGFFKFGLNEVQAIAPPNANAYSIVGEPQNVWINGNPNHQTCEVQFYRIEADTTKQIMRANTLAHNYDLMLKLVTENTN